MSALEQKGVLREELLERRQELPASEVLVASRRIMERCVESIPWANIKSLHSYAPMAARKEVNSWWLLEYVWEHQPHVTTVSPIIQSGLMQSVAIDDTTRWRESLAGIPEPLNGIPLPDDQHFDVIIIPIVGFDRHGHRLGYGKGHYDKFLSTQPDALKLGVAYAVAEVELAIPAEPHDVPLQHIVTESEIIYV